MVGNQPKCEENPQENYLYLRRTGQYTQNRDTSGVWIYTYNTKNQQTQVELEDGTVQTNRYDPEGLRHEMEENGKLLCFVYHKGELVYERGEKEQTSYHQGAGTEALNRAGKIYYYHKDEQLSTAFITDETGTVSNCYRYDAFGNILDSVEQIENRIRYTGQQYDGITGQYYLRARYYNPAVGRFMQEDTYRGDGLNLYAYCANNPVTYYDPSGYAGKSSYVAADGGDGGAGDAKPVKPESAVTGSKKHGVNWKEGPARAKSTGNPQGQWAQSDLEYATEMANTLKPRESGYFSLPEGAQSIVYMPDGTVQPATQMWIRNNGTGTWHGYPMQ